MAADLGTLELDFRAKLSHLDQDLETARAKAAKAGDEMGAQMERRLGAKMEGVGKTLTRTLTPAAAGFAAASGLAFREYDAGADTIIAKTGATGEALDSLEGSMKKVAGGVTSGFGDIGSVVGDLNTALGLTGKPLEDLTSRVVKLHELGESFDTMDFTRFLGDWSISSEDAGGALDRLYKIAQVTGIGVGDLMSKTVQFGAPMRALGFDVDTSTALIAKFAKEGVNTEAVLAGMKVGLGKMAKAGEEPQATFNRLVGEIKNAKTEGDAFAIAAEAFGTRAGPDLAMAIREGRFGVEELSAKVADSAGSIDTAHTATLDWSDKLEILKNKAIGVVGPVGEIGMAIGGIGMAVGPAVTGIGKVAPAIGRMVTAAATGTGHVVVSFATMAAHAVASTAQFVAQMVIQGARWVWMGITALASAAQVAAAWLIAIAPIALVVAAIAGAVYLVVRNWDTIVSTTTAAWDWVYAKVGAVVEAVVGFLRNLIGGVVNFVQEWGVLLLGPIGAAWKFRDEIWGVVQAVIGFFGRLVSGATEKGGELISLVAGLPGRILGALGDAAGMLYNSGLAIMRGLASGIWDGLGNVLGAVGGVLRKARDFLPFSDARTGPFSDLTLSGRRVSETFAHGILMSRPAVIGAMDSLATSSMSFAQPSVLDLAVRSHWAAMDGLSSMGSSVGGGDVGPVTAGPTYIIQGSMVSERDVGSLVRGSIANVGRHNNGTGLG